MAKNASTPPAGEAQPASPFNPRALITIFVVALLLQAGIAYFRTPEAPPSGVALSLVKPTVKPGQRIEIQVANHTEAPITIALDCLEKSARIEKQNADAWDVLHASEAASDCPAATVIAPGGAEKRSLTRWDASHFQEPGRYRVALGYDDGQEVSAEFEIVARGWLSAAGLTALYQPLYNALIWLSTLPGMSFGFAIILLTLLVRAILFIPTYRSLGHQAEMQAIQPELQDLQAKYKDNKEKLGEETLKLYKERGVNPCGSCLPILIQLPVLWAMYFVLSDGLDAANRFLLYPSLQGVDLQSISTSFLGLDMLAPKSIILALLVGGTQFFSMKLTHWMLTPEQREKMKGSQAAVTNATMTYFLPVFIAWISYTYPSGLGLYWGTSTLFGIGQQLVLKRAKARQAEQRAGAPVRDAEFRDAP